MLRASSEEVGIAVDLETVATGHTPALAHGAELAALVDALTTDTARVPSAQLAALVDLAGAEAAERCVAVCATFQMMNRLLDGTGTPLPPGLEPIATTLGFDAAEVYGHGSGA